MEITMKTTASGAHAVAETEPTREVAYFPRTSFEARLEPFETFSPDEKELVETLAKQLAFVTAAVAAEPDANYPPGSVASRIQRSFAQLDEKTRATSGRQARALLAKPGNERRRYFGRYASSERERDDALRQEGLSAELKAVLNRAVRKRLEFQRSEIVDLIRAKEAGQLAWLPVTKTTLKTGFFIHTDVPTGLTDQVTINEPQVVDFRWATEEEEAEEASWELRQVMSTQVIASGFATKAPGGDFRIDFTQYLPPTPPQTPRSYHVRVYPRTSKKIVKDQGATPGGGSFKESSKIVGQPSFPVTITYAASSQEPTTFDFATVYLKLDFHFDHIEMIQDQSGPGDEEFHIAGFIREVAGKTAAGGYHKIGPVQVTIDPRGDRKHTFPNLWYPFALSYPDTAHWPRVYSVVFTIMEEDGGEQIGEWLALLWDAAEGILKEKIEDAVKEALEEMTEELIEEVLVASTEGAEIAAGLAGAVASAIAAVVVYVIGEIIAAIIADMQDDFYGAKAFVMMLASNRLGQVTALAGGKQLSGQVQPDGSLVMAQTKGRFYGAPGANSASAFDGIVELGWHWRLSQAQQI
jgi:hypothetical protein